ncbi:MAG: hypothetical protein GY730_10430 [bacterium]|nr:hypothetical protein [bacterium]
MSKLVTVQEPAPLYKAIKTELSNLCWQYGMGTFFTEKVPFAGRSCSSFAEKLTSFYLNTLYQNYPTSIHLLDINFHIYELASGLGILAKHFMDNLKIQDPEIYKRTILHITDNSEPIINKLSEISLLYDHAHQIELHVLDAKNPNFKVDEKPVFVFSSYLLSSFNSRQIELTKDSVKEILIETYINADAAIIDTTEYPPKAKDAQEIKELLTGSNIDTKKILAPKILPLLIHKPVFIPVEESSMPDNERSILSDFIKTQEIKNKTVFNYSYDLKIHTENVVNQIDKRGVYFITDFGNTLLENNMIKDLNENYGSVTCNTICFPHLLHCIKKQKASYCITNHTPNRTQELIVYKYPLEQELLSTFQKKFHHCSSENVSKSLKSLLKLQYTGCYKTQIDEIMSDLNEIEKTNYLILKQIAFILYTQGYYQDAFKYALKLHKLYGELAIDGLLLMGWICQHNTIHEDAVNCFNQVLVICSNDATAYAAKSLSNLFLGQTSESIENLKKALFYCRDDSIWQFALGIGLAYLREGNIDEAATAYSWPLNIQNKFPDLVPESQISEFQNTLNYLIKIHKARNQNQPDSGE